MVRSILAFWFGVVVASSAEAEWRLDQFTDRMTDEVHTYAFVRANEPSDDVTATLRIRCVEGIKGVFRTRLAISVSLSEKMPEGVYLSWRVDEHSVQHRHMPKASSGNFSMVGDAEALRQAKRFRLQWLAPNGRALFYEFNVSGIERVMAQIPCADNR